MAANTDIEFLMYQALSKDPSYLLAQFSCGRETFLSTIPQIKTLMHREVE